MDVINSKEDEPQVIPETQNIVSPLLISDPKGTGDDESTQSPEDSVKNTPERTTSTNQSSKRDDIEFSQHAEGAPVTKKDPHQSKSTKSLSKMVQEVPIKPAQVTEIIDDDDDDDSDSKWSDAKKRREAGHRGHLLPPSQSTKPPQTRTPLRHGRHQSSNRPRSPSTWEQHGGPRLWNHAQCVTINLAPTSQNQWPRNILTSALIARVGKPTPRSLVTPRGPESERIPWMTLLCLTRAPRATTTAKVTLATTTTRTEARKGSGLPQSARPPLPKMRARLQGAERQGEVLREAVVAVHGRRELERRMTSRPHLRAEASHLIGAQENLMTSLPRDQTTCLASQPRPLLFPFTWCATRCRLTSKDFRVFFVFFLFLNDPNWSVLVWVHSRNTRWGPPALVSCVTTNLFPTTRYHSRSTFVRSARGPTMRRMLTWTA